MRFEENRAPGDKIYTECTTDALHAIQLQLTSLLCQGSRKIAFALRKKIQHKRSR